MTSSTIAPRREYRRLLITYALQYFPADERLGDLDGNGCAGSSTGSVASTDATGTDCVTARCTTRCCRCARACDAGLAVDDVGDAIVLPRRRQGRAHEFDERRFLTSQQLARLLAEIPERWRTLFELLASTALRISEAIGLRVMDAKLDTWDLHLGRCATWTQSRARRTGMASVRSAI